MAVQTKVGAAAGTFYYTYTDHLGNVTALSTTAGAFVTGSKARYDPFGTFTTTTPTSNPSISNHGFTGHRHNNTGTNDLDLIYMNARYYMPLVGRFISPDTIVPEPGNPQSFNRYVYVRNNPMNFTDPTGHMESSGCDITDCTNGGTVNPNTYRAADGSFGFVDPTLSARYPSALAQQVTHANSADAFGAGFTFNFSLDTPIAGIELMAGREAIHVRESGATTNFIIVGGGVRVGPSTSFINSLKGIMKGGSPINATVSPYVSAVQNVDDAAADYSGNFVYNSTTAAYQVGVTIAESYVPGPVRNTVSSTSIGPAFGYALTTSAGTAYSIPTTTWQPGQLIPTFHNPLPHLRALASWIWSGITGD